MDVVCSVHFMVNWENMFSLLCQQLLINVVVVGRIRYKALDLFDLLIHFVIVNDNLLINLYSF